MPAVEQLAAVAVETPSAAQAVEVIEATTEADEEESDPYVINEAIGEPLTSSGVRQTSEAPETAAAIEPEVVEDEMEAFASSAYQAPVLWGSAPQPVQTQKLTTTARAADYTGECPKSSSLRQPALWQRLSASSRAEFPLPKLGSSVYGRKARQRFVVVDQTIFREGQALPNGVTLLKVRKATAVLSSAACVVEVPLRLLQR